MKTYQLTIEVPDDERKLRIFKGWELIGFVEGDTLFQKTESCNWCGECCMSGGAFPDEEGRCKSLVKFGDKYECSEGIKVPWYCMDDPKDIEGCSIRYKKVKVK